MKKYLLAASILFFSAMLYGEDTNQQSRNISIGVDWRFMAYSDALSGNYTLNNYDNTSAAWYITFNEPIMFASAYFDWTYLNISAGYGINSGQPSASLGVSTQSTNVSSSLTVQGYTDTFFDLSLYLKYPIGTGIISFWPAVGIEKVFLLNETYNGGPVEKDQDEYDVFSPLLLKIGAGLNLKIDNFVVIPYVFYGFDLTPTPSSGAVEMLPISRAYGSAIIAGVSFGFLL